MHGLDTHDRTKAINVLTAKRGAEVFSSLLKGNSRWGKVMQVQWHWTTTLGYVAIGCVQTGEVSSEARACMTVTEELARKI